MIRALIPFLIISATACHRNRDDEPTEVDDVSDGGCGDVDNDGTDDGEDGNPDQTDDGSDELTCVEMTFLDDGEEVDVPDESGGDELTDESGDVIYACPGTWVVTMNFGPLGNYADYVLTNIVFSTADEDVTNDEPMAFEDEEGDLVVLYQPDPDVITQHCGADGTGCPDYFLATLYGQPVSRATE